MKDIKLVAFDYDDTLVNSLNAKWAQHKYVAKKEYNKILTDEEILTHWTRPYSELICVLYGDADIDHARKMNVKYENEFPKELFTSTVPVLQKIKSRNLLTAIVTSTSSESIKKDIDRFGEFRNYIDYIQTEDDTDSHKPDPKVFDPLIKWFSNLDTTPEQVLYVGDGLHDMRAALAVGFNFIGVTTGLVTSSDFESSGINSINSLDQLPDSLD